MSVHHVELKWPRPGLSRKSFLDSIFGSPHSLTDAVAAGSAEIRRLIESDQSIDDAVAAGREAGERILPTIRAELAKELPDVDLADYDIGVTAGDCLGAAVVEQTVVVSRRAQLEPGDLCLFVAEPSPVPSMKYYAGRYGDDLLFLSTRPEMVIEVPLTALRYCQRVEFLRTATALPVSPERNELAVAVARHMADTELCLDDLPDMRPAEATTAVLTEIRRRWLASPEAPTGADFLRAFVG